ncbi:hypothetical protein EXIGLDRAFT_708015 [Exidia glandulosa HHB12029]|uniref:Uncharacterized protein n=1 Tax=Exidia glandulosa HHB12029 TaxID=1314781 RepID=A0A166NBG2_EXIGL|nr:hypothetical protein EXIGLDRAFT_708015 [Exidia glandulosa HHB12029]
MATAHLEQIARVDWMHLGDEHVVEHEHDADSEPDRVSPLTTPSPPPSSASPANPAHTPSAPPSPETSFDNTRPLWGGVPESQGILDEDVYRRRPGLSGWIYNDLNLANQMISAAYTAAMCGFRLRGHPVRRLNCHWNRPLDHDVKPHGYNKRGDLAPQIAHIKFDILLDKDHFSFRERMLAHGVLDKIWLLHSRSERVDDALDREMWFLSLADRRDMGAILNDHMLDDLRLVMCALDPRKKVIYGRTRDSNPAPRLMQPLDADIFPHDAPGSDDDDTDNEHNGIRAIPFTLSPWEQHTQYLHECMRRVRRMEKQAVQYEDFANQAQIRVNEIMNRLERANTLHDTIMRGIQAERGPLDLLDSQRQFAFAGRQRRRDEENEREFEREATAENRPPTPPADID